MSKRIPSDNLVYAVLLSINEGKSVGSGFRLRIGDLNYLVTARHVLYDRHEELYGTTLVVTCRSPSKHAGLPLIVQVELDKAKILSDKKNDIAAILIAQHENVKGHDHETPLNVLTGELKRPSKLIAESYVSVLQSGANEIVSVDAEAAGKLDNVSLADDVYLLGYPTSLGMQNNLYYDFSKPLVRKGVVAGIDEARKTFIVDCAAYPGNSGGPVVELCDDGYFRVTGVVSKYIPYETKWHSNRGDTVNTDISNSGYTVCVSMEVVISLIEKFML